MYNGIGLQTARGSGTNGYVQKNLSCIYTTKDRARYRTEEELQRLDADIQKKPNAEILDHIRKRAIELKIAEMEDVMREEGYSEEEVESKVSQYRDMLMEREKNSRLTDHLGSGRPNVRETHSVAEAQQQKNARLKEAFGISEYFVEGSSLDPDRKNKEEAARQAAHLKQEDERRSRKHEWVSTPSPSPKGSPERKERKEKKKKKKRTRNRSSSHDSSKRRKSKKSKRSRSRSPKKKKRSREKKKKTKSKKSSRLSSRSSSSSRSPSPRDRRRSRSQKKSSKKSKSNSKHESYNSKAKKNSKKLASTTPTHSKDIIEIKHSPNEAKRKPETEHTPPARKQQRYSKPSEPKDQVDLEIIKEIEGDITISHKLSPKESVAQKDEEHLPAASESDKWRDSFQFVGKNHVKTDIASIANGSRGEMNKKLSVFKVDMKTGGSQIPNKSLFDPIGIKHGKLSVLTSAGPVGSHKDSNEKVGLNGGVKYEDLQSKVLNSSLTPKGGKKASTKDEMWSDHSSRSSSRSTKSRSWSRSSMSISPERPEPSNASKRSRGSRTTKSRSRTKSKSGTPENSKSRKWSHSRSTRSKSRSRSRSQANVKKIPSRSRSRSKSSSRSRSYSSSYSEKRSRSRTPKFPSTSKYSGSSRSRSRSRSNSSASRSRSRSLSKSRSRSGTGSRSSGSSKSRSPSIPRRRGSPSFLDKRRITSARKRPVPYHRPTPPPSPTSSSSSSSSYWWSNSPSRSRSWSRTRSPSYSR